MASFNRLTSRELFCLTIFLFLCSFSLEQNFTSVSAASLEYDGIFGIGWAVFACIIAVIVGVLCCIFGLATIHPGVFLAVGFCIPITTLIFMAFVPLEQPGNLNLKDNQFTNVYIVVKWLYFTIMLAALIALCVPLCYLWSIMLIPQRVDSRAQRDYLEKFQKLMKLDQEKKMLLEKEIEAKKASEIGIDNDQNMRLNMRNPDIGGNNANEVALPVVNPEDNPVSSVAGLKAALERKKKLMGLRRKKRDGLEGEGDDVEKND